MTTTSKAASSPVYAFDAKAITLEAGEIIDNGTDALVEHPVAITEVSFELDTDVIVTRLADGAIRSFMPQANVKVFRNY